MLRLIYADACVVYFVSHNADIGDKHTWPAMYLSMCYLYEALVEFIFNASDCRGLDA